MYAISLSVILLITGGLVLLRSQTTGRELIAERVDESKLITLSGNTRPEANVGNDLGPVADDMPMDHMMLQLKRSAEQEKTVARFVADLDNRQSPNFHKWLTPTEFGQRFGLAESDLQTITNWLESHGFKVNLVYPSRMVIDFSGNAGQVAEAFHTSIHNLNADGVHHIANMSDPQIPEALGPAVAGVVSLHDFKPHKMSRAANKEGFAQYTYSSSGQVVQAVVPADLATIYDFNPLFTKGTTGTGQTIAVLEDTDLYRTSDWTTFRSTFGLTQYAGTLSTVHPGNNCSDPGVNGDDVEATLDVEWASAAAPAAAIELASCADTATFGVFLAGQNLVNASTHPSIISISYGECEAYNGASGNAAINSVYQQGVAEGISIFVAAGDEGAASCDADLVTATHGIGVAAQASTPYNLAAGGTDFSDTINGTNSQYWSNSNTTTYGSAISYIPEIPWNGSCAGGLNASYNGFSTGYGPNGFCSSTNAQQNGWIEVTAGSGGPSNCATGAPSNTSFGVASGTCQGYPKPSWQTGAGVPNDGVRDIPDVSMFASNGVWGHYYVTCFSDTNNGGAACRGAPSNWAGYGGTSLAAPILAGIQALINETIGSPQGNPNPVYYSLAASAPSVFHKVTQGDNVVNCSGIYNCYGFVGTLDYGRGGRIFTTTWGGALSVSGTTYTPAYSAGSGWNFATGLGSVDVNLLVTNWPK
jgi:subtilase family serine protease